jgi:FKBP-type peptidyl-prolyl cis-trans isomerase 2
LFFALWVLILEGERCGMKMKVVMMKTAILLTVLLGSVSALTFLSGQFAGAEAAKKGGAAAVAEGKTVTVNYTLKVDGKVLDSSKGKQPIQFTAGNHQMIAGFEKAVMGMKVGERKSFKVSPEEGYGKEDPKAIKSIQKSQLPPDIKPAPGMVLQARDKSGRSRPVKIVEVKKDSVVIDFNHPLAGKTLHFDVEIVSVK